MEHKIGEKIKDLRQFKGISQSELSSGICTQGFISKVEKNETYPTANVLFDIATRLGVDLNYFYDGSYNITTVNYVNEVMDQISYYMDKDNYHEVLRIIKTEKNNPLFKTNKLQQYILWREGICTYFINANKDRALKLLDESLSLANTTDRNFSEIELDILSSKAIIYSLEGELEIAESIYGKLIVQLKKIPLIKNEKLKLRILFNASKNKYDQQKYDESTLLSNEGISYALNLNSLYCLGELYYQKGKSALLSGEKNTKSILENMKKAKFIFNLKNNKKFVTYVDEEIDNLNNLQNRF